MRAPSKLLLVAAMSIAAVLPSCKTTSGGGATGPGGVTSPQPERKAGMPRPYKLDAKPELAVHIAAPTEMVDVLAAHVPGMLDARGLVSQTIGKLGDFESRLAAHVDVARSWDAAWVSGQLVVQLPIQKQSVAAVQQLLASKRAVGRFGAVDLGRGALPGPKLAWLDKDTATLTLADDERGLATGREIAGTYGKKPLVFMIDAAQAKKYSSDVPFTRMEVVGSGSDDLEVSLQGVPPDRLARLSSLGNGALTGLLEAEQIAAGASSRYVHYDRDVKSLLAQGKRAVDDLPFFVRGNGEDLLRRFGSVARSWNGRTMVGTGPSRHVLLGLGTDDSKKAAGALYHLMNGITSNLSLAKSFGVSVPRLRWKKDKGSAGGASISVIALEQAKKQVPAEYHALLDERGDLRIAVAFPPGRGAAMLVVGPQCDEVLGRWVEETKSATPPTKSTADFVAATLALDATTIRKLLSESSPPSLALGLNAERPPTKVVVRRDGSDVKIALSGPKLEGKPPQIAGDPRPVRTSPTRTSTGSRGQKHAPGRSTGKPVG
jgi:hypothetical protein